VITPILAVRNIEAILFDMNGTLRQRIQDEAWQRQYAERLFTMLGIPAMPVSFMEELTRRWKSYTEWANEHEASLSEADIWIRWMMPELPRERIVPQAAALMLVWQNRKGPTVLKPNALETIAELSRRGYRLGVISNTTCTTDLPLFIEQNGLEKYFQIVILSAVSGYRKPNPEIFWKATRSMDLDPAQCAYVGNKISYDVVGPRRAGYGMAIIVESAEGVLKNEPDQTEKPDAVARNLSELLDLFPLHAGKVVQEIGNPARFY
jgi:putative hydrolase of the HAD superfamily